jgi:hypothetical protein
MNSIVAGGEPNDFQNGNEGVSFANLDIDGQGQNGLNLVMKL